MAAVYAERTCEFVIWLSPNRTSSDVLQNVIKFDGTSFSNSSFANFTIIPDAFRAEQISFISSVAADLNA